MVAGVIVAVFMAVSGYQNLGYGMNTVACASGNMIVDILAGVTYKGSAFIGIIPMVNTFQGVVDSLVAGSNFTNTLGDILNQTQSIDQSMYLASQTVKLLEDMMQYSTNVLPAIPTQPTNDLMHKCEMCVTLGPLLAQLDSALTSSLGTALKSTRATVQEQLTGSKMTSLHDNLQNAISPLKSFKTQIRNSLGFFVIPGKFDSVQPYVTGSSSPLLGVIIGVVVAPFIFFIFGGFALFFFSFKEKLYGVDESVANPYRKSVHRLACISWNGSCCYLILVFLVGGILVFLTVIMSGFCTVLTEFDKEMLTKISDKLGMSANDTNFVMVSTLADKCLSIKSAPYWASQPNVSFNLADIITLTSNGTTETVRQKIIAQAFTPINNQFSNLDATKNAGGASLSTNAGLLKLRDILRTLRSVP